MEPPNKEFFKLNIDGASKENSGPAGAGGIIRDCEDLFIAGFAYSIGITTNNRAELWALWIGLQLAQDFDIHKLIIETDSMYIVNSMTSPHHQPPTCMESLHHTCRRASSSLQYAEVKHCTEN
ncbi:UNVERIFIED_CONTAM: hypothetical protein Slati_0172700 [Sesamum latifolium]|uniref:RNase H type-1 domain-containing protein n=1 Tax=Sesamum latifolium TaxID=2727402 RepID=A0AAW2YAC4_9LAMI